MSHYEKIVQRGYGSKGTKPLTTAKSPAVVQLHRLRPESHLPRASTLRVELPTTISPIACSSFEFGSVRAFELPTTITPVACSTFEVASSSFPRYLRLSIRPSTLDIRASPSIPRQFALFKLVHAPFCTFSYDSTGTMDFSRVFGIYFRALVYSLFWTFLELALASSSFLTLQAVRRVSLLHTAAAFPYIKPLYLLCTPRVLLPQFDLSLVLLILSSPSALAYASLRPRPRFASPTSTLRLRPRFVPIYASLPYSLPFIPRRAFVAHHS